MSKCFSALMTVSIGFTWCSLASAQTLTVVTPSTHADSKALRDLDHGSAPVHGVTAIRHHHGELPDEIHTPPLGPDQPDPLAQLGPGPLISASAGTDFEGLGQNGFIPSDNNIAVGPNHIVETVNVRYAVYTKAGVLLTSGFLKSLWTGLAGSSCGTNNGGDPVVQYDRFADRWIITQLGSLSAPYSQCIAVSKTSDPTGAYSLYSYSFGAALNDYPKFGVWPTATNSAYLATYNLFYGGSGAELCAYDRAAMLAAAANPIGLCYSGLNSWSYLPSDVDGSTPPLDGTPGYFVDLLTTSSLGVYKLKPNFAAATATLTGPSTIAVAPFTEAADVPQPSTTMTLDPLSDRLMYRLGFRMYADHEAMAVTHSVATGGVAAARWYELRSPISTSGTFTLFQQGTFAPGDGNHRWMGSIAMDQGGNMGLGYSVSGPSRFPSIRYTGRTPGDPAGTMETEASLIEGQGSQLGYDRWGDYSSMRIDPSDDCTFWYVNEYYAASASFDWHTRIGSFKFTGCGAPPAPDFSLSATPASLSRVQGASGDSVITVNAINGFNGSTNLSIVGGCPSVLTCTFNTNPVGAGGTSTLTLATTSSTPPSTYNIVVQGDSGALTHTTTVAFTVTAPASDFSMTLSTNTLTVRRKSSATLTVNLTGGGGPVTLSVTGLPSKVTATFTPNPVATVPGSSTLKISANPQASLGTFPVKVSGNGGGPGHEQTLTLTVTP
jgi:hypothetical protein